MRHIHRPANEGVEPTHRHIDQRVRAPREQAIMSYLCGKRA
jgi:hypothetical protein